MLTARVPLQGMLPARLEERGQVGEGGIRHRPLTRAAGSDARSPNGNTHHTREVRSSYHHQL